MKNEDLIRDTAEAIVKSLTLAVQTDANSTLINTVRRFKSFAEDSVRDWNHTKSKSTAQILPEGTRLVKAGKLVAIAIEQKPRVRSIWIDSRLKYSFKPSPGCATAGGPKILAPLSLPYVVFVICMRENEDKYQYSSLCTFFRRHPLRHPSDMLGKTILPNMSSSVCMGPSWSCGTGSMVEISERVIGHYWGAHFTMDYTDAWIEAASRVKQLSNLSTWMEATQTDPDFILNVDWQDCTPLDKWLNQIVSREEIEEGDADFIGRTTLELQSEISNLVRRATSLNGEYVDRLVANLTELINKKNKKNDQQVDPSEEVVNSTSQPAFS